MIAIVGLRRVVDEQLDYLQGTSQLLAKRKPAVNFMIFIRRMLADERQCRTIGRRPAGQREHSHKDLYEVLGNVYPSHPSDRHRDGFT